MYIQFFLHVHAVKTTCTSKRHSTPLPFSLRPEEGATDYYRTLDLTSGVGTVHFKSAKTQTEYLREYFASNPDKAVIARYTANGEAKLNLRFTMQSGGILGRTTSYDSGMGFFSGNTFNGSTQTVKYALRFKVVNLGSAGVITTDENGVTVTDADYGDYGQQFGNKKEGSLGGNSPTW